MARKSTMVTSIDEIVGWNKMADGRILRNEGRNASFRIRNHGRLSNRSIIRRNDIDIVSN